MGHWVPVEPKKTSLLLQAGRELAGWHTPSEGRLAKRFHARDTSDHSKGGVCDLSYFSPAIT